MSEKNLMKDPTNRIVSVFDDREHAEAARQALLDDGFEAENIRLFHGEEDANDIDTSAKWFADTDAEIGKYRRELKAGKTVVSIPVSDSECRDKVHGILKGHDARMVTHFGQWITKMLQ